MWKRGRWWRNSSGSLAGWFHSSLTWNSYCHIGGWGWRGPASFCCVNLRRGRGCCRSVYCLEAKRWGAVENLEDLRNFFIR